jgi:exonuclease VII large subunit
LTVLARGYAIVLNERGQALTRAQSVEVDAPIVVRLAEGRLRARVIDHDEDMR